jgi:hypothetical protein
MRSRGGWSPGDAPKPTLPPEFDWHSATLVGMSTLPNVELLYFAGCPNYGAARASIERIAAEEDVEIDLRLVEVTSPEEAEAARFLGSPSIRVNGRDVEPGADDRDPFILACRVYQTEAGIDGRPSDAWIRAALR